MDIISAPLSDVNSVALHPRISAKLSNGGMRPVDEIRRSRLRMLAHEFGSYAQLNDKLGRARRDSTLSQIANQSPNSKGGSPKTMGSNTARALERVCKKPIGWMDTDPNDATGAAPPPTPNRKFDDRREVSETDWAVLQAVKLVLPEQELERIKGEAERIRRTAREQIDAAKRDP